MRFGVHLAIVCLLALPHCAEPAPVATSPLEYTQNAKRDYERALEDFYDQDWLSCIEQMTAIRKSYAYSRYARLAQLRIADAYYRQEKFADAIGAYKSFVHDYPNDPEVPYARFRVTQALFAQVSESLLLPPLEERDLTTAHETHTALKDYLSDFSADARRQRELAYMLEYTSGLLARHELYVARYYLRQDKYEAAVARTKYALERYAGSGLEPEALVLLGETYLRLKQPTQARSQFQRVLREYPDSPFVVPARKFLARADQHPMRSRP